MHAWVIGIARNALEYGIGVNRPAKRREMPMGPASEDAGPIGLYGRNHHLSGVGLSVFVLTEQPGT
jgi:hypothetical protein